MKKKGKKMEVKVKSVYRHFKGNYYFVEDIATHSETGEKMVVYRALYGDRGLWVRPYSMFAEELPPEKQNGQTHRFELCELEAD